MHVVGQATNNGEVSCNPSFTINPSLPRAHTTSDAVERANAAMAHDRTITIFIETNGLQFFNLIILRY